MKRVAIVAVLSLAMSAAYVPPVHAAPPSETNGVKVIAGVATIGAIIVGLSYLAKAGRETQANEQEQAAHHTNVFQATEVKAYRDINFGESRDVVTQRIRADANLHGNTYASSTEIQNRQYGVKYSFRDDRLYQLKLSANYTFSTRVYSASYFDTKIAEEVEALRQVIEVQYGPPSFVQDISILDTREGQIRFQYGWVIDGQKEIKIGIAENSNYYWVELWIGYTPVLEKIKAENVDAKQKATEESAINF